MILILFFILCRFTVCEDNTVKLIRITAAYSLILIPVDNSELKIWLETLTHSQSEI